MCGIVGSFAYADVAPPVDRAELLRTREFMRTRGPDGEGLWVSPNQRMGLAHRRLAIIDVSEAGSQPMATADGRLHIVFNGEIYNYRELRDDLRSRGVQFRSESDTEVLLQLYRVHGRGMVPMLRGMFAFAIFDQENGGLFVARDPFGIKPVYLSDDGSTFRFASQVKALQANARIALNEDPAGYVGFLVWGFVPEPFTLFKQIRPLPAGTHLWVGQGGRREEVRYFDPRVHTGVAEAHSTSDIESAVADSVKRHLVSDVPVGLFLSSGIDSCAIASFAANELGTRLHTLTLGFSEFRNSANDETVLAARVAKDLGVRHLTCWTSRDEAVADLGAFFEAMDLPSMDGMNSWLVSKAAHREGIKVALSGLGGDEMFAGYPSFRQVPLIARAVAPFRQLGVLSTALRRFIEPLIRSSTSPKYAGLFEYGGTLGGAYLLRRALYMPWELERVLDPAFVREGLESLDLDLRLPRTIDGEANERLAVSLLELDWYLKGQLLRDADWAGMAHSVEIRVPFVDVGVFAAMQREVLRGSAPTKARLLKASGTHIESILGSRPKTGFNVPIRDWFIEHGANSKAERGIRSWARRVLAECSPAVRGGG